MFNPDHFQYDREFAFLPPVHRNYGEGTFPPCILNGLYEQSKSDKRRESPHGYITYHLYVGARRAKQG
eukprot:3515646-Ditylum_brightwellii.AAC.1